MSRRELFFKTFFIIVLPLFAAYLLFSRPAPANTCLLCVESVASPAASSLTVFGPSNSVDPNAAIVGHPVTNPHLLARFVHLSLQLRRYQPDVADLKQAPRSYRLHVNKSLDTCQVELLQTKSGRELVTCYDGTYYECPRLVTFADSLFRHVNARTITERTVIQF